MGVPMAMHWKVELALKVTLTGSTAAMGGKGTRGRKGGRREVERRWKEGREGMREDISGSEFTVATVLGNKSFKTYLELLLL